MPTAWPVKRKNIAFISKPNPGSHKLDYSVSLLLLLRDVLGYAQNAKEARYIVNNQTVNVNGKKATSIKKPLGLFDVVEFPLIEKRFVILFDEFGKIKLVNKKDNNLILKVVGKKHAKGKKYQLNAMNGYNLYVDEKTFKKISVGDSVSYDPVKKKVLSTIPLDKKSFVYIFNGKYRGQFGQVEDFVHFSGLAKDTADIIIDGVSQKTLKEYCYPVTLKEEEVKEFQ